MSSHGVDKSPKRRKRKRKKDPFMIAGVKKLVLSELTQKLIGMVVGENINAENAWMMVNKEPIQDNLDLHEESSEFLPIKTEIMKYPGKQIFMGYVLDDSKDEDEFYICTQDTKIEELQSIIERVGIEKEARLQNAINKIIKEWVSLGSEQEVDLGLVKNNRPLIEVEVEASYPMSIIRSDFEMVVAEDRRDGYMELKLSSEERITNVFKRRIDAPVQIAPQYATKEVQTTCTYPSNAATQYEYDPGDTSLLLKQCVKPFKKFTEENYENISDMLRVNGAFNLYSEDYLTLLRNEAELLNAFLEEEVKEYMSFMDVDLCRGKMIADMCWHPMWTGTVAVCYSDQAPYVYHSGPDLTDWVLRATQGTNPVVIWSCMDGLKPKLILDAPREVTKISICKFDENIIVGGMKNGQIIIWDIRNKLQQVEESLILTMVQQKNRAYMNSLMRWMKKVYDVSFVRATAISDMKYSHKGPINGITWVSPFYEFTKLGRLIEVPEPKEEGASPYSMQFITGGEDGNLLIWDLVKKPQLQEGGFKPRKLKRLKGRPSALLTDVSPYAIYHLNLKPIYKVIIPRQRRKPLAIANCHENMCPMKYAITNPLKSKKQAPINERIVYHPIMDKTIYERIKPEMQVGSMEGDFLHCFWEGQDFDSGEIINSEAAEILARGKVHDGPLYTAQMNRVHDVTLTVGGRIFALWKTGLMNRPVMWRRRRQLYTSGEWNITQPYLFTNKVINGDVESWNIAVDSKLPAYSKTFSSGYLTASGYHTLKMRKSIYGAGDKLGSLRLFFMPEDVAPGTEESKNKKFSDYLEREVIRKNLFLKWQEKWNKKNAELIAERELIEELHRIKKSVETEKEEKKKEKEQQKEKREKEKEEEKKEKAMTRKGPQPGKFIEWMIHKRQLQEEAQIKATIIAKKQLDTKELERRRKPLQKLEEENERKKRKQRQRIREGENIFKETVSTLFPDVMKAKPPPPPDPYASVSIPIAEYESKYQEFLDVKDEANKFIDKHPYNYVFNWRTVISSGQERRDVLGDPTGERKKAWKRRIHRPLRKTDSVLEMEIPPETITAKPSEPEAEKEPSEEINWDVGGDDDDEVVHDDTGDGGNVGGDDDND